jgi:crotonobetainyl-CoA:carnitine CoA-transferase CaiB-like acyl-CoA transferase
LARRPGTVRNAPTLLPFLRMPASVIIMDLPLGDIRVIDLTIARAGPTCVRQLADWGADVIRVEPPDNKDGLTGDRHGSDFQQLTRCSPAWATPPPRSPGCEPTA